MANGETLAQAVFEIFEVKGTLSPSALQFCGGYPSPDAVSPVAGPESQSGMCGARPRARSRGVCPLWVPWLQRYGHESASQHILSGTHRIWAG